MVFRGEVTYNTHSDPPWSTAGNLLHGNHGTAAVEPTISPWVGVPVDDWV